MPDIVPGSMIEKAILHFEQIELQNFPAIPIEVVVDYSHIRDVSRIRTRFIPTKSVHTLRSAESWWFFEYRCHIRIRDVFQARTHLVQSKSVHKLGNYGLNCEIRCQNSDIVSKKQYTKHTFWWVHSVALHALYKPLSCVENILRRVKLHQLQYHHRLTSCTQL